MNDSILIALLVPIAGTIGALITWAIKSKREQLQIEQARSRESKIKTYQTLLEPFIAVFTGGQSKEDQAKEISKITSLLYKKAVFELTTFGSDRAVLCFNAIMATFYSDYEFKVENGKPSRDLIKIFALICEFMREIRKDVFSTSTRLNRSDMVTAFLKDIEVYKVEVDKFDVNQILKSMSKN